MARKNWKCHKTNQEGRSGYDPPPCVPVEVVRLSVNDPDTGDPDTEDRKLIDALHILPDCPEPESEGDCCVDCPSNVPKEGLQVTIGGAAVSAETDMGTEIGRISPGY